MNEKKSKEKDILRDTTLRYLGYANEVGEAFRSFIPRSLVQASYGVASFYALADATLKCHTATVKKSNGTTTQLSPMLAFVDALLWQSLASVLIPGFVINRLCACSLMLLRRTLPNISRVTHKLTTTSIGLLAIPLIVSPIDRFVDATMDGFIRKLYPYQSSSR